MLSVCLETQGQSIEDQESVYRHKRSTNDVSKNQRPVLNLKQQEYRLAGYEANRYNLQH